MDKGDLMLEFDMVSEKLTEVIELLKKIEANQVAEGKNRVIILRLDSTTEIAHIGHGELRRLIEMMEEVLNEPAVHRSTK